MAHLKGPTLPGAADRAPAEVAAIACDPRMTVAVPAEPPSRGTVVEPVGPVETAAVREHLVSDAEARDWGRDLAAQAGVGVQWCALRAAEAAQRAGNRP
jgi:hypothetical protein